MMVTRTTDVLEFTPEVAVLVSAAQLASEPDTPPQKQLEIWKTAVEEILNGLEFDNSKNGRELWDYKLHAVVFCSRLRSLLNTHDMNGDQEDWGSLKFVLTILPPFPREVYYSLVRTFHWRKHFIECLLFLNETVCLLFLEEVLSFCCQGSAVNHPDDCELLLTITEVYMEKFINADADSKTEQSMASRKASGLYMFMGSSGTPVQSDPDDSQTTHRHSMFLQNLLFCAKKLCCSEAILNSLVNAEDISSCKISAVELITAVLVLGGQFLLPKPQHFNGVSMTTLLKWSKACVKKEMVENSKQKENKYVSFQDQLAQLKSGNFQELESCYKTLCNFQKEDQPVNIPSVPGSQNFPTNQWRLMLQEVFSCHQWVETFTRAVETGEDGDPEVTLNLVTMDIKLASMFVVLEKLMLSSDKSATEKVKDLRNGHGGAKPRRKIGFAAYMKPALNDPPSFLEVSTTTKSDTCARESLSADLFTQLLGVLQPVITASKLSVERVSNLDHGKKSIDISSVSMEDALVRINQKLAQWEDCLDMLLNREEDEGLPVERFLPMLEENQAVLCTEQRVTGLFKLVLAAEKRTTPKEIVQRIWQVLVSACSSLPTLLQDHLIATWYGLGYAVLPDTDADYRGRLTTVFNRLVDGRISEAVYVIGLTLQNPPATLQKAVMVAIKNKHQAKVIVKILQRLPAVCQCSHGPGSGRSLLCGAVQSFLATNSLTPTEEDNLMEFLTLAVQSCENTSVPKVSFVENPILDPEEFLLLAVVPYISKENMMADSSPISARLALNMFNCLGKAKCCGRLSQPFVVLLCLCEMLQDCEELWDRDYRKDKLKGEIITAMSYLPLDDPARAKDPRAVWFRQHLTRFSLPVVLRLRAFLGLDEDQCLQMIAAQLWTEDQLDSSELKGDNQYESAFRFSAIDEACLQITLHSISQIEGQFTYHWEDTVLALAQVLPNLLPSEWLQVLTVCEHLLTTGRLILNYPCTYSRTIPCIDLTSIQIPLGLAKLLADVCMVWNQSEALIQPAWVFVAQGLATAIREICLAESRLDGSSNKPKTFLLAQVFCQLCQIMSTLPPQAGDHLYVLLLQTLNLYKGVKSECRTASSPAEWRSTFYMCHSQELDMRDVLRRCSTDSMAELSTLDKQLEEVAAIHL